MENLSRFSWSFFARVIAGFIWSILLLGMHTPAYSQSRPFRTLSAAKGEIKAMTFSPSGRFLAFARSEGLETSGQVRIWDLEKQVFTRTIKASSVTTMLCFSPNGEFLAVGSWPNSLEVWNLRSGRLIYNFTGDRIVSFSRDSNSLISLDVSTYASGPGSLNLRKWDVKSGKLIKRVRIPLKSNRYVAGVALSHDWKSLAVGIDHMVVYSAHDAKTLSGEIRLYDAQTGRLKRVWQRTKSTSVAPTCEFSPDGKVLAIGDWQGRLVLRSVKNNAIIRTISTGKAVVSEIAFAPDGKTVATESQGTILI